MCRPLRTVLLPHRRERAYFRRRNASASGCKADATCVPSPEKRPQLALAIPKSVQRRLHISTIVHQFGIFLTFRTELVRVEHIILPALAVPGGTDRLQSMTSQATMGPGPRIWGVSRPASALARNLLTVNPVVPAIRAGMAAARAARFLRLLQHPVHRTQPPTMTQGRS